MGHSLAKRVAIVTGAGQGNGQAIAATLAAAGARVAVNDINPDRAERVAPPRFEPAVDTPLV
jgi:NAD(P)-dependent dehydrogenase (short-subunit alcohol dehydrogenase family)